MDRLNSLMRGSMMGGSSAPPGAVSEPKSKISIDYQHTDLLSLIAGLKSGRQLRDSLHILSSSPQDVKAWPSRCTYGGHGLDVGRICG